jgi:hypothetical protein
MKGLIKVTGVLILCAIVSCKKDQLETTPTDPQLETITDKQLQNSQADWSAPSQVEKAERANHTVFYTNIKAPEITAETGNEGMIRIYKKDELGRISSHALPLEETNGAQKTYWYYEISEGNIMVSADVYGGRSNPFTNSSFKYIVMDDMDMQKLQSKGITRKELKRLSYDELNRLNN